MERCIVFVYLTGSPHTWNFIKSHHPTTRTEQWDKTEHKFCSNTDFPDRMELIHSMRFQDKLPFPLLGTEGSGKVRGSESRELPWNIQMPQDRD